MAKSLGLSVSAYVRCLIKYSLSKNNRHTLNQLEIAIQDTIEGNTEAITLDESKKE